MAAAERVYRLICQRVSLSPPGGSPGGARRVRSVGWHSWPGRLVLTSMGAPLQQSAASALPEGSHTASCQGNILKGSYIRSTILYMRIKEPYICNTYIYMIFYITFKTISNPIAYVKGSVELANCNVDYMRTSTQISLRGVYRNLRRRRGAGVTGGRNEYLRALAISHDDPRADSAIAEHERFALRGAGVRWAHLIPAWFFLVWSSCYLTPLRRKPKPGRTPAETPPRPIAVSEPTQRAFATALTKAGTETYKEYLMPQQLAIGVWAPPGSSYTASAPHSNTHATTSSSYSTRRTRFKPSNGPLYWSAWPHAVQDHRA